MSDKGGRNRPDIRTRVAQALHFVDEATGAVVPPIMASSTFARDAEMELYSEFIYSRYGNPTVDQLEKILCALEGGAAAMAFTTGLAAFAAIFETVETGKRIVVPRVMYHGGLSWLRMIAKKRRIDIGYYEPGDLQSLQEAVDAAATDIVWIETPTNPTWDITDIAGAAEIAHKAGAYVGIDNTCASPVTTQPLELGADIVFHSATKYINGHSDVTAGALVTARDDERWQEMVDVRKYSGAIIPPFEAWLVIRGARTLFVRYETAAANALAFAEHFEGHSAVESVAYPGLPSHPRHDVAKRQMTNGFGGMVSVLVKGDFEKTKKVASRLQIFLPATSLGGVESLVEHRKAVEGPHSPVPDNLIRFSIGIEKVEDLIADLEQALV